MKKLLGGIKYDFSFIKSHTLQPGWWKVMKVFVIIGFLVGYSILFGFKKMLIFFGLFLFLNFLLHMVYRVKTVKFTQSWLDFVVNEEEGEVTYQRIGFYYYAAIIINTVIAIVFSIWVV